MEKEITRPSEEILQALEEIANIEKEDQPRRKKPKRSSILKLPRNIDDDEVDDLQSKRKSLKRRVSFAENFQVLEMNTGNIYDIPGKGGSDLESGLNEDLNSVSKSHAVVAKEEITIHTAGTEIQVSSNSEMIQIETEHSHLTKSKKHGIISDKDIGPNKKKLHIAPKDDFPKDSESNNVFIDPSNLMSQFKTYLFDENCDSNTNKDKDISVHNAIVNNAGSALSHKRKSSKASSDDNLVSLKINRNELVSNRLQKQEMSKHTTKAGDKSCDIVLRDSGSTELKLLPISLSDIPLEQNKENIYIDSKNKNIFLTNTLHLKLKDENPRSKKLSNSESRRLNTEYLLPTSGKSLLDTENFNSSSSKASDSEVKHFREKTCILDHSMDLTCVPSNLDHIENSTEDDPAGKENMSIHDVLGDGTSENHLRKSQKLTKNNLIMDKLDKTCIETSLMDLTHVANADNVLDSTNNDCDVSMQNLQSLKMKRQLETGENMNAMEITCHDLDLTCNFLSSTRIDYDTLKLDKMSDSVDLNDTNEKEGCKTEKCFQFSSGVKHFSHTGAKETYDLKSKDSLFNCDLSNLSPSSKQSDNESCHLNMVDNCPNEILTSCRNTLKAYEDVKEKKKCTMPADQIEIVDSNDAHEKSLYVPDEMEFTCCEKDLSIIQSQNCVTSIKESTSVDFADPTFPDCTVADPNTSVQKFIYGKKATSSFTNTNDGSNFVLSKTQHLDSDYITADSSLAGERSNDSSQKVFSETKRFSSLGMELTCVPSVVNSNKSTIECEGEKEKIVSNTTVTSQTRYFGSDNIAVSGKSIEEDKNDYSKTKRFSSIAMELTCIHPNVNPMNSSRQLVAEKEKVIEDNVNHSRSQPLKSDCLEMNTKSYLSENKTNYDNCTSKNISRTKCSSSINMDLTCMPSIANPMNSTRQYLVEDEKIVADSSSKSQPLVSDYMVGMARSSLVKNSDNSPSKSSSRTKHFSSTCMELTCIPSVVNPTSTVQCSSKKEDFAEENWVLNECHHSEDKRQLIVTRTAENKDKILYKKTHSSFLNSTDNRLVNETNQNFGLSMNVVEDEMNRTGNQGETLSKTKKFSSFGMELTCMPSDNNSIFVRKHKIDDEDSVIDKCYPSKYQKVELGLDAKKIDSVDLISKQIPVMSNTLFSSDVDLCSKSDIRVPNSISKRDPISKSLSVSKDSSIRAGSNSSNDSVFLPENKNSDTGFNTIRPTDIEKTLVTTNNPSETQLKTNPSNSKIVENVKKIHFNNEFMFQTQSKSSECHSKIFVNVQNSKADLRKESEYQKSNLSDIETSNASNPSNANKTPTCRKNEIPIPEIYLNDYSYNNSIESLKSNSDIVYAVKQLKDMNQTVAANPFKFPEAFLTLKKQPKSSCSKIHFSEPLREVIRLSSVLNNSHYMELNKMHSSPAKNEIVGIPNKAVTEITDKTTNATPQSDQLNKVQTSCSKTVRKSLIITYGSSTSEKEPFEKHVIENKSHFSVRKSLETTVRKSLDFNDEVNNNVSSVTITHVTEENLVKNIASKDENLFLDSSDLENCSVSLVSNTVDSFCSKINSKIFDESNAVRCKNKTYEQLPEQLSRNSMFNTHAVVEKSCIDAVDQVENDSVLMKQKLVPEVAKIDNSTNEELNAYSYQPVNTLQLMPDITGKEDFTVEKTNQCLGKKEISEIDLICKINTSSKKGDKSSKEMSVESNNNLPHEMGMSSNLSSVGQDSCGLKSHEIINTNPNTNFTLSGDNISQMHELSNAHLKRKSFDTSVSSSQVCVEEVANKSRNAEIEKPKIILTETSMQNPSITVDSKEIDSASILEMDVAPMEDNRNRTSTKINKTFISNEKAKNKSHNAEIEKPKIILTETSMQNPSITVDSKEIDSASILEMDVTPMEDNRNCTSAKINKTFISNEKAKNEVNKIPSSEKSSQSTSVKDDNHSCSEEARLHNITNPSTSNVKAVCQNINMESVSSLADIDENRLPKTPSQNLEFVDKIHYDDLRRKLKSVSQGECRWTFIELRDEKAVFEILDGSAWACYYMYVPVEFGSQVSYPSEITFEHSKEDVDEVDELGFSYFMKLVSKYTRMSSFSVDKLLENLEKVVQCALQAKSLMKDVTHIYIRHDFTITYSDDIPKLTVEIFNLTRHSLFSLTFPIDFKSYPQKKITPEIKHLEHNEIQKEILLDALEKVHPGTNYLINMVKAVNEL